MSFRNRFPGGPVPERWLECPSNGNQLIVSKFMPSKTPLNSNFDLQIPRNLRYHPQNVFSQAKKNKVKISLWIDLTNTTRYYRKEDIQQENCEYVKIQCKGHGEAPTPRDTQYFISVVEQHIRKAPFDCVAVHCTHGFNRTGFLITAFLVEKLKLDVRRALQVFSDSRLCQQAYNHLGHGYFRPPGIYKDDYIKELFRRYGRVEDAPLAPTRPSWCEEIVPSRKRRNRSNSNERIKFDRK